MLKIKSKNGLLNGVTITYYEYGSDGPAEADWPINPGVITSIFCIKGNLSIRYNSNCDILELAGNQHNIYFTGVADGKIYLSGKQAKLFCVQFSKKTIFSLADTTDAFAGRFVDQIQADKPAVFSESPLPIDLDLLNCINSIINYQYRDSLKRMYVFSKAVELFVLQAESLGRLTSRKVTYLKKEYDHERILFARDYLVNHIQNPPTLSELSRVAGINEFKLKKGFKETFNQPVFAWLADIRLETARNELMKKSKTATEIAFELGYSSPQHFSSAFKKKFGVSPTKIS